MLLMLFYHLFFTKKPPFTIQFHPKIPFENPQICISTHQKERENFSSCRSPNQYPNPLPHPITLCKSSSYQSHPQNPQMCRSTYLNKRENFSCRRSYVSLLSILTIIGGCTLNYGKVASQEVWTPHLILIQQSSYSNYIKMKDEVFPWGDQPDLYHNETSLNKGKMLKFDALLQ